MSQPQPELWVPVKFYEKTILMPPDRAKYVETWRAIRDWVFARDEFTCQICGKVGGRAGVKKLTAHHVKPRREGGSDEVNNLLTVHESCHEEMNREERLGIIHLNIRSGNGR